MLSAMPFPPLPATPASAMPAATTPLFPTSLPPAEKRYRCERGCDSHFTSSFAQHRHQRRAHPLPGDTKPCPTCNASVLNHLYSTHVAGCAAGDVKLASPHAEPTPNVTYEPLDTAAVDAAFAPFIAWLGAPAATIWSQKVKETLVTTEAHKRRISADCRNLARVCWRANPSAFAPAFFLGGLVARGTVDLLHAFHRTGRQRDGDREGVGHDVRYKINLLLVKVITFLAETSGIVNMQPTAFESWVLVKSAAHHASHARRLAARTKNVLGANDPLLTAEELHAIVRTTAQKMDALRQQAYQKSLTAGERYLYTQCLVTALFILLQGPRSQVMRLTTTTTLFPPDSPHNSTPTYEIRLGAEVLKNNQAGIWVVPSALTQQLRFYLARLLPPDHTGPVWLTDTGAGRVDFGPLTSGICYSVTGKLATPTRIRAAIATYWAQSEISNAERRGIASIMGHSVQTAEQFYVEQQRRPNQHRFTQMFLEAANLK